MVNSSLLKKRWVVYVRTQGQWSSSPLKVLLVTGSYPPQFCGVGDYSARLASSLVHAGCLVDLLASGKAPREMVGGVGVRREMGDWSIFRLGLFKRILNETSPDLIHFQYPSRGFGWKLLPVLLPLWLRIFRPSLPVVTTLHEFRGSHPLRKLSYLFFTLFSCRVVTPSEGVRKSLESFYPWTKGKTQVVPVGSFLNAVGGGVSKEKGYPLLVFLGFLLPEKGPWEALQALALILPDFPEARLLFASELKDEKPFYRQLAEEARRLSLEDRVVFLGRVEPRALARLLKRADMVLLPFRDGASTRRSTLSSAITLGACVVTTETPDLLPDFRRGGVVLCKPKDPRSLAAAIRSFLRHPKAKTILRKRLPLLQRLFDWKRIAAAHRVLYGNALRGLR